MPRNVEIKAAVAALDPVRAAALRASSQPPCVVIQTDTFFPSARGRLKLRRLDDGPAELIFYERPDQPGPVESAYDLFPVADPDALLRLLQPALGIRGVVAKRREVYWIGQTRVHLDEVEGLGSFVELEVVLKAGQPTAEGERAARALLETLGIEESALIADAYIDLLERRPGGPRAPGGSPRGTGRGRDGAAPPLPPRGTRRS